MCCSNTYPQSSVPNTRKCQFLLPAKKSTVVAGDSRALLYRWAHSSPGVQSRYHLHLTYSFIITTAGKESIHFFFFFLISAVKQSDQVIHIYVFFIFFSTIVYPRMLNIVPVLYSRALLPIHSICNSMQLPAPNFQLIPLQSPYPLTATSLFSVSESLFLLCRQVHLCHILDCTYK